MSNSKKKVVYEPTGEQLERGPRAFHYELEMFRTSAKCCMDLQAHLNAALENALLHARNLLDFFVGGRPYKGDPNQTDMRAGYFVEGANWWKSSKLNDLREHKADINKSLSHLTFDRTEGDYRWDVAKIMEEIENAYVEFLEHLGPKKREEWMRWEEHTP